MKLEAHNYRLPFLIALSAIAILTVFSIYTWKERMFFLDASFITFGIINTKELLIQEYRYGSFITQIFPLIGTYAGLSLKTILILYSVSFYLFYSATALLIGFVWKQKWLAILLALYLTVFVSDGFYWSNNEVHQGIAWIFIFLAVYLHNAKSEKKITSSLVLTALAFFAISCHLIGVIILGYLWLYIHIDTHKDLKSLAKNRFFVLQSVILLVLIILRYIISNNSASYDTEKLSPIRHIKIQSILNAFTSGQSGSFIDLTISYHWIIIPVGILGFFFLLKRQKYKQLLLTITFCLGYYVLVCLVYPNAFDRTTRFYIESEWAALAIILATPFVLEFPSVISQKRFFALSLFLIFSIKLCWIYNSYDYFNNRLENLQKISYSLQNRGIKKALIIDDKQTSDQLFIMDWGVPIESILLSTIDQNPVTFKVVGKDYHFTNSKSDFASSFWVQPISSLNGDYFALDTTQEYTVINGIKSVIR